MCVLSDKRKKIIILRFVIVNVLILMFSALIVGPPQSDIIFPIDIAFYRLSLFVQVPLLQYKLIKEGTSTGNKQIYWLDVIVLVVLPVMLFGGVYAGMRVVRQIPIYTYDELFDSFLHHDPSYRHYRWMVALMTPVPISVNAILIWLLIKSKNEYGIRGNFVLVLLSMLIVLLVGFTVLSYLLNYLNIVDLILNLRLVFYLVFTMGSIIGIIWIIHRVKKYF